MRYYRMIASAMIVAVAQALTIQMSHNSRNHPRPLKTSLSRIISSSTTSTTTSNNAVATGCQDYGDTTTLKSRFGFALSDIKNRIRRQRPRVEVIEDVSDFDSILKSTNEQFVAVFFHSPVCKACQAAAPHFYKLAQKYSNVKFLSVPLTPGNKKTLQQDLGVKKFPFGHIYHSQHGLLDELPILRKLIPHFEERLQTHVSASSELALETRTARQRGEVAAEASAA